MVSDMVGKAVAQGAFVGRPLKVGIIGMGGWCQVHHQVVHDMEKQGECRLVCACDPHPDAFSRQIKEWDFAGRGVRGYKDFIEMLDAHGRELDVVCVPTPIFLHASMHLACVERGCACYLEKPPTLYHTELEQMISVESRARRLTQVAFNFIVEPMRQRLKSRILAHEFGAVRRAGLVACWPRPTTYFTRNDWAGRLLRQNQVVLDFCLGNALAHYLHNLLFWSGPAEALSWADVDWLEAELYRAHATETPDTVFARGRLDGGTDLWIAATHTGRGGAYQHEWVECEHAVIDCQATRQYSIRWRDGRREHGRAHPQNLWHANMQAYFSYLRDESPRPLTRLVDSRPFVHFCNLLYVAAGRIHQIPEAYITRHLADDASGQLLVVEAMADAMTALATSGRFPSEGNIGWAGAFGRASRLNLGKFRASVDTMHADGNFT